MTNDNEPMTTDQHRPKLRATVDLMPFEHGGRSGFLLRDSFIGDKMLFLAPEALALLVLFDGQRTVRDIQNMIMQQTGQLLPGNEIEDFVQLLDQHLLLDSPRYAEWMAGQAADYASQPFRTSLAESMGLPGDAAALRALLDGLMDRHAPQPPDLLPDELRGLVVPHIDIERGQLTYAKTWRSAAQFPPADVYIVLGVNHHFMSENPFIVTDRAYESPLGCLPFAAGLFAEIQFELPWDLLTDQIAHRGEHSIEFPSIFLRYLHPDAPISILPVLCNFLDREDARVIAMIAALRKILSSSRAAGRKIALIASVDFSHIGPQFGARQPVSQGDLIDVGGRDRETLKLLAAGMPDPFWDDIMADSNARHIDALYACYTFLRALAPCQGRLINYEQAFHPQNTVTFAGMVF